VLRGWCAYFQPGVSSTTFAYLASVVWRQVMAWLRRKHRKTSWKSIRRYCDGLNLSAVSPERHNFSTRPLNTREATSSRDHGAPPAPTHSRQWPLPDDGPP
jgi:RNA-directed DNA polymerase